MHRNLRRPKVTRSVEETVQSLLGDISKSTEADSAVLAALCLMRVSPSGKEDPRALMRQVSDGTVNKIAFQFKSMNTDPIMSPIAQLFLIEWAYRRDYLNQDWKWEWDTDREGQVRYDPKLPLDQIIQATNVT